MTVEEKIELIKTNKEEAVVVLNGLLDANYNVIDSHDEYMRTVIEEMGQTLKENDEAGRQFVANIKEDVGIYEKVRRKLLNNDFNLSLLEINYIGLAYMFYAIRFKKTIDNLKQAQQYSEEMHKKLIS